MEKKTDLLLDVIYYLKKKNINVLIHLIGDGPYLNILKEKIKKLNYNNNFKFYGSLQNEKYISKIIFASDFTIIPAIAGLSIIHSFCYGTPVATLISDNHPPEFLHAINFKNSILDKTVKNLSFKISELYKNKKLYLKLRHSVRTYYEEKLTLNNMLIGFTKAIKYSFANKSK